MKKGKGHDGSKIVRKKCSTMDTKITNIIVRDEVGWFTRWGLLNIRWSVLAGKKMVVAISNPFYVVSCLTAPYQISSKIWRKTTLKIVAFIVLVRRVSTSKKGRRRRMSIGRFWMYSGTSLQGISRDRLNFSHRLKFLYSQYRNNKKNSWWDLK